MNRDVCCRLLQTSTPTTQALVARSNSSNVTNGGAVLQISTCAVFPIPGDRVLVSHLRELRDDGVLPPPSVRWVRCRGLAGIPGPKKCSGAAAIAIAIGIAAASINDLARFWFAGVPYISDTITTPPESCYFGFFLNVYALLLGISIWNVYTHVSKFSQSRREACTKPAIRATVLGESRYLNIMYIHYVYNNIICVSMRVCA